MKLPVAIIVVIAVLPGLTACPINARRDGIGAACDVDVDLCPTDHTCLAPDDDSAGLCAPVLTYGSCPAPTYPQNVGETKDDDIDVDTPQDLAELDGVVEVTGDLFVDARLGSVLQVGDLCALSGLQRVGGSMLVAQTNVTSLDGLQGLAVVGDGIGIASNRDLTDLTALNTVIRVEPPEGREFTIVIADNASVTGESITALKAAFADRPSIKVFSCGNIRAVLVDDERDCPVGVNALLRR